MASDAELAASIPRIDGRMVLGPDDLAGRTHTDFETVLRWLGILDPVHLRVLPYLPGQAHPEHRADRRNGLSRAARDFATLGEEARERLSATERSDGRVFSDHELNEVRLSWEKNEDGPVDLARKAADPRRRDSDGLDPGLYTRSAGYGRPSRAVFLNLGLWAVRPAIPATIAHECTHAFLDGHGAQLLDGRDGNVRSRVSDDEARRTDSVAVLLGFGVLLLNGAVAFGDRVGSDLPGLGAEAIAREHLEFCEAIGLSGDEAARGMSDAALEVARG